MENEFCYIDNKPFKKLNKKKQIIVNPQEKRTEEYITGRFG